MTEERPIYYFSVYHEENKDPNQLKKRIDRALKERGFRLDREGSNKEDLPLEYWYNSEMCVRVTYPKLGLSFYQQSPVRPEMYFEINALILLEGDLWETEVNELERLLQDVGGKQQGPRKTN